MGICVCTRRRVGWCVCVCTHTNCTSVHVTVCMYLNGLLRTCVSSCLCVERMCVIVDVNLCERVDRCD